MMVPFFKINFDTILRGFNSNREMPNCPLDTFFMKPTHITETYACSISYESP